MEIEELINQQINNIKGIRQPTRLDVIETLDLLANQTQDFRKFYLSNYFHATSVDPEKSLDDLLSYPQFTKEVQQ